MPSSPCLSSNTLILTGVGGIEGTGDIMNTDNITEFQDFVLQTTDGNGVHIVMADGVSCIRTVTLLIQTFFIVALVKA